MQAEARHAERERAAVARAAEHERAASAAQGQVQALQQQLAVASAAADAACRSEAAAKQAAAAAQAELAALRQCAPLPLPWTVGGSACVVAATAGAAGSAVLLSFSCYEMRRRLFGRV